MRALKRLFPLVVSIAVVVAVALVGLLPSARANATAQQIRRDDRVSEERDLASLTNQYVMFALKDAYDFVSVTPLSLKPGDPADTAHIKAYVKRSALLNYGGALVSLSGSPLNAYSAKPGLPPATDPGYATLGVDHDAVCCRVLRSDPFRRPPRRAGARGAARRRGRRAVPDEPQAADGAREGV